MNLEDLFRVRETRSAPLTSTLAEPSGWLLEAMGSQPTHTGDPLSKTGSEALPVLWACKQVIEQDLAKLPLDAFQRTPDGGRRKATDTIQHHLVRERPNPEQTPSQFKSMLAFHILSYGGAFCEIEREDPKDHRSPPKALWPLLSDRTKAKRFEGVKLVETRARDRNGKHDPEGRFIPKILLPGEYVHIPGRGFDGLNGYSPLEFAKEHIALGLAETKWLAKFYDGDAMAGAWVSVPSLPVGKGAEEKRRVIREAIRDQVGGLNRSHRVGILWDGAELQKTAVTPREQQLVEGMNLNGYQLCRFFRVMPHKVQLLLHATFTNIEHQALEHVTDTLMPWTTLFKEAFDWELWPERQRGQYFFDWNFRTLLRGDAKSEAEAIRIGVAGGWISRAEARQLTNRNPAPEDQGLGDFLVQVNQVPSRVLSAMVDQAGSEEGARALVRGLFGLAEDSYRLPARMEAREVERDDAKRREEISARSATARNRLRIAHEPIFLRSAERYIAAEVRALERMLTAAGDDLADFRRRALRFYRKFPRAIRRELAPVLTAFGVVIADSIGEELGAEVAGENYDIAVEGVIAAAVTRHISKSQAALAGILQDHPVAAEAREALAARLEKWLDSRPTKVAKSESVYAGGRLAQDAYAAGGVRQKRWVTFGESCPLCRSLDGQVVGITDTFLSPGDTLNPRVEGTAPLQVDRNIRHAPLHGGCDCAISAA